MRAAVRRTDHALAQRCGRGAFEGSPSIPDAGRCLRRTWAPSPCVWNRLPRSRSDVSEVWLSS